MSKFCGECGAEMSDEKTFCTNCGAPLNMEQQAPMQPGPQSQAPVPPPVPQAAQQVPPEQTPKQKKSPLLWVILGVIAAAVVVIVLIIVMSTRNQADRNPAAEVVTEESEETESSGSSADSDSIDDLLKVLGECSDYMQEDHLVTDAAEAQESVKQVEEFREQFHEIEDLPASLKTATEQYFALVSSIYSDWADIMTYMEGIDSAMVYLDDFSAAMNADSAEEMYTGMDTALTSMMEAFDEVSCPASLQESFGKMKSVFEKMNDVTYRLAIGIEWNDVLRQKSAGFAIAHLMADVTNSIDEFTDITKEAMNFMVEQSAAAGSICGQIENAAKDENTDWDTFAIGDGTAGNMYFAYNAIDTVYPTLYNSYDQFLVLKAGCIGGEKDVIVEVEIPEFSQTYSNSYHIGNALEAIYIKPAALGGADVSKPREAQMNVKITEKDGTVLDSKTFPVKLESKNVMAWYSDEFGVSTQDNILCFLEPESEEIAALKRAAVEVVSMLTEGQVESIAGYQDVYGAMEQDLSPAINTYLQAAAIMNALSEWPVRYVNDSYTPENGQHILLPSEVLEQNAGLCIETSLVVASALQSAGFHTYIVMPSGHAQVAVELWEDTGEYFLIETTDLPNSLSDIADYGNYQFFDGEFNENAVCPVMYLTQETWAETIASDPEYYVIDCADLELFGYTPFQ